MPFDQKTRNLLQRTVSACRKILDEEFASQRREIFGINDDGTAAPLETLAHLPDEEMQVARLLRDRLDHLVAGLTTQGKKEADARKEAVGRLTREQAFTVLNRLAALRMAEEREIVLECVRHGLQSEGFLLFQQSAGGAFGETWLAYRAYLLVIFDELAIDLGVLFSRWDPAGLLFPGKDALEAVLKELGGTGTAMAREDITPEEFNAIWSEDETIGWIYQYYNDAAERKKMRDESAAPRNSRELAVRNQFFTPRYVVEFLTDNTLGRIWYEMTQGVTTLKEQCRYLVRRPNEIFLDDGEAPPAKNEEPGTKNEELSQEELLRQPVHIPHRPLKDPRTILMLDPACGSMHFGLYAFDLFEVIYDEAWDMAARMKGEGRSLKELAAALPEFSSFILHTSSFSSREEFLRQVPRLIIEHNLHGIDIDPRCAQIAGLSLWLRAQKAWQRLGLAPAERPAIKRSNIVCAEPMPGEKELLREFVEREFPAAERGVCLRLLEAIFDKMQLAGEAGSLLKIEEEIRSAIEDARDAWQKLATRPPELFTTTELNQLSTAPELTGLEQAVSSLTTDPRHLSTDFWERIEERIYAALRDYAEQAENGGGFQRRLFAEDAARGFAFIDVCRKRYDVALMNPPFGDFSKQWKDEAREAYPNSYNDILGTFVDSFLHRLRDGGRLGAITSRTCFFLTSFTKWRTKVVLERATMGALADLGHGVMDDAMVEAAAYVLQRLSPKDVAIRSGENRPSIPHLPCFRILKDTEKESALLKAISSQLSENLFLADPSAFALASGNAFTYWVSPSTLQKLNEHPPIEGSLVTIRVGLQTGDDWRFLRQWWEVSTQSIALNLPKMAGASRSHAELRRTLSQQVADGCEWVFYSKTDYAAPWYSPLLQVVNWKEDGKQFFHFADSKGKLRSRPQNLEFYLRPGFSYMLRSFRLVPYLVPAGAIPTAGRAQAFPLTDDTLAPLAICASNLGSAVARFNGEKFAWPKFQASMVQSIPSCNLEAELLHELLDFVRAEVSRRRQLFQGHEPFIEFVRPAWLIGAQGSLSWRRESLLGSDLEWKIAEAYGLAKGELAELERDILESIESQSQTSDKESSGDEGDDSAEIIDESEAARVEGGLSYVLGCAFGRWDIRYATGEQAAPELPDPFAPLPVCPPGQLQNAQGLPARPEDVPAAYPVRIPWDGILVDDPNHPLDIERRVREVIEIIWSGQEGGPTAEAIEHEACEILGVKSLRDYFRKPAGFFADHLKRYSKSRRQAPIYWPLSTASGSYTLWIYYHRLTHDTLYKCLSDFVEPKIAEVEKEIHRLRTMIAAEEAGTRERKQLADSESLLTELREFHADLTHWAPRWKPNLNDGVQITASPLWKLFRLPKWQKTLKETWQKLEKGDYDWAHLALTLWPDRVREKCKKDRSLAIAHDLEDLCEIQAPVPKKRAAKKAAKKKGKAIGEGDLF